MNPEPQGEISTSMNPMACVAVGPSSPPTYQIDTLLMLSANFFAAGGVIPADPGAVTLIIQDPTGANTTYTNASSPAIVKVSTGVYTFEFAPAKSGQWIYKWQGASPVEVTSPDTYFTVAQSALIAG